MTIVIDTRESESAVRARVKEILRYWKIPHCEDKLYSGDYYISTANVLVERKTVSDLIASIEKLGDQLARARELCPNVMLVLEGRVYVDRTTGFIVRREGGRDVTTRLRWDYLTRRLFSVQLLHGIHYFNVNDLQMFSEMLVELHQWGMKPNNKHLGYDSRNPASRVVGMYSCIPGIGEVLAQRVAEQFPRPPIDPAFAKRLEAVRGFGPERIKEVERFLRGDPSKKQAKLQTLQAADDRPDS